MTPEEKKNLKRLLITQQEKTLKDLKFHKKTLKESVPEDNGYSSHMADQGTDTMEREKTALFITRNEKYLMRIKTTLKITDRDDYGICRTCAEEISHERMLAVPTTDICTPCKESIAV